MHIEHPRTRDGCTTRSTCRICGCGDLFIFADFGDLPLAGRYLTPTQISFEKRFPLRLSHCPQCSLVQVIDVVPAQELFADYQYISSIIPGLRAHFAQYAQYLLRFGYLTRQSLVIEFGCNDGVLLDALRNESISAVGVDASPRASQIARDAGHRVITGYFKPQLAREIAKEYGLADLVTGSNVFAHVDDVHSLVDAVRLALHPQGLFAVEVHYLPDLLACCQYDTVYHEHMSYYSLTSLQTLLNGHGFRLLDAVRIPMHGGGLRLVACNDNADHRTHSSINELLSFESTIGIESPATYESFFTKAKDHASSLKRHLISLKRAGQSISGYGAPGRGTVLLNFADIGRDILEYIVDISPLRAGKIMPGVHIPIAFPSKLKAQPTDSCLILAWNYSQDIVGQETEYLRRGGSFVIPFPTLSTIRQTGE